MYRYFLGPRELQGTHKNTLKPKKSKLVTFTLRGGFFTFWAILAHSAPPASAGACNACTIANQSTLCLRLSLIMSGLARSRAYLAQFEAQSRYKRGILSQIFNMDLQFWVIWAVGTVRENFFNFSKVLCFWGQLSYVLLFCVCLLLLVTLLEEKKGLSNYS